jgi:arginyl-tRNA synthetase
MKEEIVKVLKKAFKKLDIDLKEEKILSLIEIPKDYSNGDFSFPCFIFADKLKEDPHTIALEIRKQIGTEPINFSEIQVSGPYINFFLDRRFLTLNLLKQIETQKEKFGGSDIGKRKKIVVEFSSPNIAKPFGVGHLRSTIIGNSISKILDFQGYNTIKLNYLGDWGTQFGKLIAGFIRFGNQEKLKKDPIKHLYEIYVKINKDDKYEAESRDWFRKLEEGDNEALRLWEDFKKLSLESFNKIYSQMGIEFDEVLGESMYNESMEKVVKELGEKKLLKKSKGALIVNLSKFGLGVALIKKSDGATLYATRDLASAIDRHKKYKFYQMIYEVGQEQKLHFKQVFKILELMGYEWSNNCIHIDHGLYLGKDKKRLATRKGKTFFMEDLIQETKELAEKEIKKRFPNLSKKALEQRAMKVAIAAIFYGDLKNKRTNNIVFDLEKFVSFEGNTGPYLLYSYARASSIIRKAKKLRSQEEINSIEEKELNLAKKLAEFPKVVEDASKQLNPSLIANYSYKLSQTFNEFYHACPVLDSHRAEFRLRLVNGFKQVLKNSLNLLGIETLEEM